MKLIERFIRVEETVDPSLLPRRKTEINAFRAGIVLGTLLGSWHMCWAFLVALGWAQPVLDFLYQIHFMEPIFKVSAFDINKAGILVAITALSGFIFGYLFVYVWNTALSTYKE